METSPLVTSGPETWAEQFTASLHTQRDRARQFLAAQCERMEQAEALVEGELRRLREELESQRAETERLRLDRDALATRLTQMDSRFADADGNAASGGGDFHTADADLERRYELAVEDIRQLKSRNADLQQEADKARSTAAKLAQQAQQSGTLDWEAEKQRILAALETDCDEDDESQQAERLKINNVLRTTDEVVAAKDAEIQELQQQLEQSAYCAAQASNATEIEAAFNADSAIIEERERLKRLQEQWQAKLRAAEVELAVERAKIARQRAELEEQARAARNGSAVPPKASDAEGPTERPAGRRWLTRLGLTEADRTTGRQL
jgi:hypothetical protein